MARRKKPTGPITLDWSFLDDSGESVSEEQETGVQLDWSFLDDSEGDDGYAYSSRKPGRKGLGPAVEPKEEVEPEAPSLFQSSDFDIAPVQALKFGFNLGQGIATPEGREALGEQVGGTYGMKGAASEIERLTGLRKYETEEQRREALSKLRGSQYGLAPESQGVIADVNYARELFSEPGRYERELKDAYTRYEQEANRIGNAEKYYDESGNIALRTVGDVAANAESGLSLLGGAAGGFFGGPAGAVGGAMPGSVLMADVAYDMSFVEAVRAGVPEAEAREFAGAMASSEFVLEALGGAVGGKLATTRLRAEIKEQIAARFSKYLPEVNRRLAGTAGRVTAGGATGYLEEGGTEALQMGVAEGFQKLENTPEFQKFLREQAPRNADGSINMSEALAQWNRAGMAGGLMGGGITTVATTADNFVETQKRTAEALINNTIGNEEAKARAQRAVDAAAQVSESQFNEEAPEVVPPAAQPTAPATEDYLNTSIDNVINQQYQEAGKTRTPTAPVGIENVAPEPVGPTTPLTAQQRGEEAGKIRKKKLGEIHKLKRDKGFTDEEYREALTRATGKNSAKDMSPQEIDLAIAELNKTEPSSVEETAAGPEIKVEDVLSKIKGVTDKKNVKAALESTTKPRKGGMSVRDVIKGLVKAGRADTESAVDLINQGKLGIVQRESELPGGLEKGRDGWYDPQSKRVWLVADNLDPTTVRGTAVHEINHFLNLNRDSGKPKTTGISKLIGDDIKSYNSRIRTLAERGNKVAQRAVQRAEAAANRATPEMRDFILEQELTSYFASEAMQPKSVLGAAAGILRDIKSAINTTARNRGIGELSANDISYVLRRQMEEARNVDFREDTTTQAPADSIIGERAATFEETRQRFPEREYRGTKDNKPRIEISDRKASLRPSAVTKLREGKSVFLGDLMQHDELYRAYNQRFSGEGGQFFSALRAVPVQVSEEYADGAAYYLEDDKIVIGYDSVEEPDLLGNLLHEVQHAVQNREGFPRGSSVDYEYDRLVNDFERTMNREPTLDEQEQLRSEAWKEYNRSYGEAEARLSERNFTLTEEELSETLPEERFTERGTVRSPTGELVLSERRLRPEDTRATLPRRRARAEQANKYLMENGLDSIKDEKGGEIAPWLANGLVMDMVESHDMHPVKKHAERMIKNHLSRYAGTANDPLNNVTSPMFEDEFPTWENMMDNAMTPASAGAIRQAHSKSTETVDFIIPLLLSDKIPDTTPVWGGRAYIFALTLDPDVTESSLEFLAVIKLGDYLSHVKDYLLTVDPAKLQQYDLVRAVKETVKWDEKMKKEAEKARVKADAQLQTYIQFPDGYRWVRLNKPGQFAAESDIMGHSVRGYEPAKPITTVYDWYNSLSQQQFDLLKQEFKSWQEEVRNRGKIPVGHIDVWAERNPKYIAWKESVEKNLGEDLALAGEGGHAAYGYGGWEAIKNDVARIYSLRDPSGKSVVTVELGKTRTPAPQGVEVQPYNDKFEVNQIKGRFNNAPPEDTHPKTRDLLRNLNEEGLLDLRYISDADNAGIVSLIIDGDLDLPRKYVIKAQYKKVEDKYRVEGNRILDFDGFMDERRKLKDVIQAPPTIRRVADSTALDSVANKLGDQGVGRFDELLDKLTSIVKLGLDPNRGIGKRALETIEYWKLKSGGIRELGEGYVVRINKAIDKAEALPDGATGKFTRKQFEDAVKKAEDQKDFESRDRAYDALVRNFGDAGREYRNGRNLIDQLTKELLSDFADEIEKTGRKPSQQELAVMNQMVDNVGQYTTRVYLLNIPATSKQWARGLIKAFDEGKPGDKYYDIVQKAIDYLINHEVYIPENALLLARKREPTIRRMYQTWIGNADNLTKDEMITRLLAKRASITPEMVDKMARRIIKDILVPGEKTTASAKFYRGAAMDQSIITAREKVPAEIRALMGEIVDPSQRILVTLSAQAELLYRHRLLNDLYDNGRGTLWISPEERSTADNAQDFTELLSGDAYGPLNGMYATKEFAYNIKQTRATLTSFTEAVALAGSDASIFATTIGGAIFRGAGAISGWQKVSKTVGDTGAWALNAAGSFLNLTKNGQLVGGKHSREAVADAIALALGGHKGDERANKRLAVLLEHGLPDSVFTSELRDVEREFLQDLLAELNKDAMAPLDKVWAKVRKKYRKARDIYGLMDAWVKIADFYGQQEYLTNYYKANGDKVSQEDINREAADIVKFRNITYSRAPTLVRAAERSGLTVFATYASEVVRTMVTTPLTVKMALQKAKAAKTPEARAIAMREASKITVGYAVAVGLIPLVTHLYMVANFGEDEEEREKFLKLGFDTDTDQSYAYLGKDKDGKVVMFNASRIDPNGHITDFVRLAAQGADPDEYWTNFVALFWSPVGNGYGRDLWNLATRSGGKDSALADTFPATTEQLENLFEATGLERQDAQRTMRLIDNWWPGLGRVLNQETGKVVDPADQSAELTSAALRATGMRMTIIDPKQAASREAYAYNMARGRATSRWTELMGRENLTDADIIRTVSRIYADEEAASRRLSEVYSALDTNIAGVDPRKTLADANVNPEDIYDAALGRYRSVVLSPKRVEERYKKAMKDAQTREERVLIEKNYRAARRVLRELNLETR